MPHPVLQCTNLTKRYGSLTAVKDLSLDVVEGEVFGFLGPNGAGKTTAINMMCGLLTPDAGQVLLRGRPVIGGGNDVRSRVGVCPQDIVLWERLTCLEQLQFIGQMYGVSARLARSRGEHLLEELDLVSKRNKQARTLSGGMKRRLNLAMALVHEPEIVVLDEPEAGLDPQSRVKVREYIQALARTGTRTVILTTHNMDEAERLADRVAIIDHGELMALNTPEMLKRSVGEGDVVEIELNGLAGQGQQVVDMLRGIQGPVGDCLAGQVHLDEGLRLLTIRALDAVGALPAVLSALEMAGHRAEDVRIRRNTLEDVFIQLTGRRLRE